MDIRKPEPHEYAALNALCFRSKAHWGYDERFMELSRPVLRVNPELVDAGFTAAAFDGAVPLGVAQVCFEDNEAELDLMFVDPAHMGKGAGAALFSWAAETARGNGARLMWILSDPQARAFYERMGASHVVDKPSDAIPGRMLPLLKIGL